MLMTPILLLALAPGAVDAAAQREIVRCAEVAFSRTAENRDAAAFAAFLDPDTRFGTGERISRGPEAVLANWRPFLVPGESEILWRPDTVEVRADGVALTHGPYRMIVPAEDGGTRTQWGTFTSVWKHDPEADRWRVIFDAGGNHGMIPTEAHRALIEADPGCD